MLAQHRALTGALETEAVVAPCQSGGRDEEVALFECGVDPAVVDEGGSRPGGVVRAVEVARKGAVLVRDPDGLRRAFHQFGGLPEGVLGEPYQSAGLGVVCRVVAQEELGGPVVVVRAQQRGTGVDGSLLAECHRAHPVYALGQGGPLAPPGIGVAVRDARGDGDDLAELCAAEVGVSGGAQRLVVEGWIVEEEFHGCGS